MRVLDAAYDFKKLAERWIAKRTRELFEGFYLDCEFRDPPTFWDKYAGCKLGSPCGCSHCYCRRIEITKADRDRARREVRKDPMRWL